MHAPGNPAFALISVSVMIAVALSSALTQFGIMVFLFGQWGFAWIDTNTGGTLLHFLSETFTLSPGLANAWLMSIIPSITTIAAIVSTEQARDSFAQTVVGDRQPVDKQRTGKQREAYCTSACNYAQTNVKPVILWGLVLLAHIGLMMLIIFAYTPGTHEMHYFGVALFTSSMTVLNAWVVFIDYGVERVTWHPFIKFDAILFIVAVSALAVFVLGEPNISAAAEWIALLTMVSLHTLLPFRGARVVLSRPRLRYNSGWCAIGRGCNPSTTITINM
jgi:hypothetical protein